MFIMMMMMLQRYSECSNCPDIAEDAFCSGAGDAAPCFGYMWGDAGWVVSRSSCDNVTMLRGPLVCGGQLGGVVSWGIGCGGQGGQPGYPWVNTDIVTHAQWIMQTMQQ